jgi:hypothetical protein
VPEPAGAAAALEVFVNHLYPGRWAELRPMSAKDRKATSVMWMDLAEASAKIRAETNHDDPGDEAWPTWAGVIPLHTVIGTPEPDPLLDPRTPVPEPRIPG